MNGSMDGWMGGRVEGRKEKYGHQVFAYKAYNYRDTGAAKDIPRGSRQGTNTAASICS